MTEPTAGVNPAMPSSGWRGRGVVAFAALVCGLYGWAVFGFTLFGRDGEIGPTYYGVGGDYTVYYAAAHAYWDGTLPKIMDVASSRPWLYPPHFLLLLVPFGLLPFAQSYAAFMVVTFAAAVAGAWRWAGTPARRAFWVAALALAPAASINVIEGQNAFLTAALLLQGFGLLGRARSAGRRDIGTAQLQASVRTPPTGGAAGFAQLAGTDGSRGERGTGDGSQCRRVRPRLLAPLARSDGCTRPGRVRRVA